MSRSARMVGFLCVVVGLAVSLALADGKAPKGGEQNSGDYSGQRLQIKQMEDATGNLSPELQSQPRAKLQQARAKLDAYIQADQHVRDLLVQFNGTGPKAPELSHEQSRTLHKARESADDALKAFSRALREASNALNLSRYWAEVRKQEERDAENAANNGANNPANNNPAGASDNTGGANGPSGDSGATIAPVDNSGVNNPPGNGPADNGGNPPDNGGSNGPATQPANDSGVNDPLGNGPADNGGNPPDSGLNNGPATQPANDSGVNDPLGNGPADNSGNPPDIGGNNGAADNGGVNNPLGNGPADNSGNPLDNGANNGPATPPVDNSGNPLGNGGNPPANTGNPPDIGGSNPSGDQSGAGKPPGNNTGGHNGPKHDGTGMWPTGGKHGPSKGHDGTGSDGMNPGNGGINPGNGTWNPGGVNKNPNGNPNTPPTPQEQAEANRAGLPPLIYKDIRQASGSTQYVLGFQRGFNRRVEQDMVPSILRMTVRTFAGSGKGTPNTQAGDQYAQSMQTAMRMMGDLGSAAAGSLAGDMARDPSLGGNPVLLGYQRGARYFDQWRQQVDRKILDILSQGTGQTATGGRQSDPGGKPNRPQWPGPVIAHGGPQGEHGPQGPLGSGGGSLGNPFDPNNPPSITQPSRPAPMSYRLGDAKISGPKASAENQRSVWLENQTAIDLRRAGFKVTQNPDVNSQGQKNPDCTIEGYGNWDCAAVHTPSGVVPTLKDKLFKRQGNRFAVNLTPMDQAMHRPLTNNDLQSISQQVGAANTHELAGGPKILEVLVNYKGSIWRVYPGNVQRIYQFNGGR